MSQPSIFKTAKSDEWVQVSAHPEILDLILRLHIRIGLCHQRLGDEYESVMTFEDAYKVCAFVLFCCSSLMSVQSANSGLFLNPRSAHRLSRRRPRFPV